MPLGVSFFFIFKEESTLNHETIQKEIIAAVHRAKEDCPLVPSITNTVTIELVANAQLAAGGSAAMVYLPDEGEAIAAAGEAFYINMGTLMPFYAETLPRTARALQEHRRPWVLDPVGIGIGGLRKGLLQCFRALPPSVVRGNASEIIALANLWGLDSGVARDGVRGVDATDSVETARPAAEALASFIHGAVAVSGERDLVTDGTLTVRSEGGSKLFTKITGAGCSLGGVTAVYLAETLDRCPGLQSGRDSGGARGERPRQLYRGLPRCPLRGNAGGNRGQSVRRALSRAGDGLLMDYH